VETIQNLLIRIDKVTKDFTGSFGSLTNEELNRKPNPQTWSAAQIIDHIIKVNESYYPVIDSVRKGTYKLPFISKFGFMVSFFGTIILNGVQPDSKRKVKTFPIWEPASSDIPAGITERFTKHQEELKALINNSADLIEKGTIISSPANKNIVYKLETAFEIIAAHEQRHYKQAVDVMGRLNNNVLANNKK